MTRPEVEPMLKERTKGPRLSIYVDLMPPYAAKVAVKPYPVGYITL